MLSAAKAKSLKTTLMTNMARVVSSLVPLKRGGRYTFSAAIQRDHLSKSSPCASPIPIFGSTSGSEDEMEEQ